MNPLDLSCLGILLAAAVAGAFLGALWHAGQLAGVVAGWVGARLLAPVLAPLLAGKVPTFAAHPLASVLAFAGCSLAATLLARALLGLAVGRGGGVDRGIGALLGAAQAALVLWVGLSALAAWGRPIEVGRLRVDPHGSELAALARERPAFGAAARPLSPTLPPQAGGGRTR